MLSSTSAIVRARSLSLCASRRVPLSVEVPWQEAASAASAGKRSGQCVASNSKACNGLRRTVTESVVVVIWAPARVSASTMAISACSETGFRLRTVTSPVVAPATSRQEAPLQSPSTLYRAGAYRWRPSMKNCRYSLCLTSMPNVPSSESVMSMYGRLLRLCTVSVVSRSASGRAISSPVMNCELSDPSTDTAPPCRGPSMRIGRYPPSLVTLAPSVRSGFSIIASGRRRIEPRPVIVIRSPQSAAIGVKSRAASPDSPI